MFFFGAATIPIVPPPIEIVQAPSSEPSTKDIYKDVFGSERTVQQVIVPIILYNETVGQGLVIISGNNQTNILVKANDWLEAVGDVLRSEVQQQLSTAIAADGTLSLRAIREAGIAINFDTSRLELQVDIPPALRKVEVSNIRDANAPASFKEALSPSNLSGYINVRGTQEIIWSEGREPLQLSFDGALNIKGWVGESSFRFTEAKTPTWDRGAFRLTHDDPQTAIRYQVGEINPPVRGYQNSNPLLGVTVFRNFGLQPYEVTRPINQFEFFLERPSQVEVFVNGQLVQTLQLDAGTQDIRNLPLNAGINDVQLLITDELGQVKQLDFATGVAGDLLAPGKGQFAYSLGFPKFEENYNVKQPTVILSHRVGINHDFTLGGYLQGNFDTQLVGVEGIWATTMGNFGWDVALSHHQQGLAGAAQLFYELITSGDKVPRRLRVGIEYQQQNFISVGETVAHEATQLDISADYSQVLSNEVRTSLRGRYQLTPDSATPAYSLELSLAKPIAEGLSVNINASTGQRSSGEIEQKLLVGVSASFPRQRQFVNASSQLNDQGIPTNRLAWFYSSPVNLDGINTAVIANQNEQGFKLESQTRYRGYRGNFSFDHQLDFPREESLTQSSRLQWGSAIVFADGVMGWARPIDNSFVMIARQGTAQGQLVQVNPSFAGDIARADHFGAGIFPVSAYTLTPVSVTAPNLAIGNDLGKTNYTVFPTYRSGTLIRVGSEGTVFVRGELLDESGDAIALQHGQIVSLSDPDWPPVELFTNRTGRFATGGLKPGRYEVYLFGKSDPIARFEIPSDIKGIYDLGTIGF